MTTDWADARVTVTVPTEERHHATTEIDLMPIRSVLDALRTPIGR